MRLYLGLIILLISISTISAQEEGEVWIPMDPASGTTLDSDWVKLNSGEWLKGELISLREDTLEFDSDEFDEQSLEWDDISEFHSAGPMTVVLISGNTVSSRISIVDDTVVLHDTNELELRLEVVSIIPVRTSWWELWNGRISAGLNIRSGNTNQTDLLLQFNTVQRTAFNRLKISYLGNYSRVEKETIASNHNAGFSWNYFLNYRFYLIPIGYDFYNNPFKNVKQQHTISIGFGYEILDVTAIEWDVLGGAGYRYLEYNSVEAGQDDATQSVLLQLGTNISADLTDTTGVYVEYTINIDLINPDNINQNMIALINVDITKNLELDLTFTWSRLGSPEARSDGSVPKKDDFGLAAGIGFNF